MNTTTATATVTTRRLEPWNGGGTIHLVAIGAHLVAAHQWRDQAEKHAALVTTLGEPAERITFGRRITFDTGRRDHKSRPIILSFPATEEPQIIEKVIREHL